MELTIFIQYLMKLFIPLKVLAAKPFQLLLCLPVFIVPVVSAPIRAIIILGMLFTLDFITGVWASYLEFKRTLPIVPGSGKRYVLQSSKLRLSVVKFICYGLAALIARGLEWAFIVEEFEPHEKLQKMTLTTIVIAFCCIIEGYSILFENVKRMGFDIIQKIKTMSKAGWSLYESVKNEDNE